MQVRHHANSSVRSKAFVAKTKDTFGSIIKAFKSLEIIPSSRSSAFKPLPASNESEDELFRPSPPFVRKFTSTSQLSGSTGSTAVASTFSRQTHQTDSTATDYSDCLDRGNKVARVNARQSVSHCPVNQADTSSFSFELESDDDCPREQSDDEDDDDDQVLLIRSKHHEHTQTGFVTSLPRNPYSSFLSQPLYKQPYLFPASGRF